MAEQTHKAKYTANQMLYNDPTRFFSADSPVYLCIDLKSFYASVECVERGLDPMTAHLVVADPERSSGTLCLAVSPALKALGVKNRCRVYEIPKGLDYITARPQMRHYIDCAAEIYAVYLQYLAPEDIHVYSIDEAFLDVTHYLTLYRMTAKELGIELMSAILDRTGIRSACGIGTNLYLAKVALDITAKHSPDFIGILTEDTYRELLWKHRPLTDFWRIGPATERKLARYGIFTMGELARTSETDAQLFYRLFGIDAEILIDHAYGREPVRMQDIKNYQNKSRAFSSGQVLLRDYSWEEGLLITKEMMQELCLEMTDKQAVTDCLTLHVSYSHSWRDSRGLPAASSHGSTSLSFPSSADTLWLQEAEQLYRRIVQPGIPIRRINLTCGRIVPADSALPCRQYSLFDTEGNFTADIETARREEERSRRMQTTVLEIRKRYGKNAVLKGMNLEEGATGMERNRQIGGHRSGESSV